MKLNSICILFLVFQVWANDLNVPVGRPEFKFLKRDYSTRHSSLSYSGVSLMGNPLDSRLQPASMASRAEFDAVWSRNYFPDQIDMELNSAHLMTSIQDVKVAFDLLVLGGSSLDGYDEWGRETGSFTNSDYVIGLSSAYSLNRTFVGIRLNGLHSEIDHYSSQAFWFDMGFIWEPISHFRYGASILRLGYGSSYFKRKIVLPIQIQHGISWSHKFGAYGLNLSVDHRYRNDEKNAFPVGLEVSFLELLHFRLGHSFGRKHAMLTTGMALQLFGWGIEYGFEGHRYLGANHRFQLSFSY
jgi:hypothetical protein